MLAGGCFWCLDAVYRSLDGVTDVVSGLHGRHASRTRTTRRCAPGLTGHAEAVAVTFDPDVIPRDVILDVFFTLHDPRQLNRQGNDVGTQYRSAMFFADDEQKTLFESAIARAADIWDGRIVTQLAPLGTWYRAEEYHQDFFAKNPNQGYCLAVALPKVNKVRRSYAQYVKAA